MNHMIPPRETLEIEFKSDKNKLPDGDLIINGPFAAHNAVAKINQAWADRLEYYLVTYPTSASAHRGVAG